MADLRITEHAGSVVLLAVCAVFLTTCRGKDGTGPPTATAIGLVSGDGQSGAVGQVLAQPLVVKATSASGVGVAGVAVTWAVSAGGGSVSATSLTTDAQGLASVTLTLGTTIGSGSNVVTASAAGLSGSPVTFTATATAGPPTQLASASGGGQTGTVGSQLPQPLVVVAKDQFGNPVPGVTMTWGVTTGGGSLSAVTNVTDTQGQSSVSWTLGPVAGQQTAAATLSGATGSPVAFSATAQAAAPAALLFTTQPSNTSAGVAITPAVQVGVVDAFGNEVATATNLVTMTLGTNPAAAILSGTTQVSAVNGTATFSDLHIDKDGTGYTLQASSVGLMPATSIAFNISGVVNQLVFTVQPTNTLAGTPITPAVEVTAEDVVGNPVPSFTGTVAISIGTNPGGGTLSGTTSRAATAGVATFSDLSIDKTGSGYTLVASATGLSGVTSAPFTVLVDGLQHLVFTVQPSNTLAGTAITPAVEVTAQDGLGNIATSFTGTVTIAIGTNSGGGTLSGTTSQSATAGVATFSDLSIDKTGSGYTLVASATGLSGVTSAPFTVLVDGLQLLVFTVQPTDVTAGSTIAPPVQICAMDGFGNIATNFTGAVTVAIGNNPSGGTLGGTGTVTAVSGCATFSDLTIDKAGTGYTLTASASAITTATSSAFAVTPAVAATITLDGGDLQTGLAGTTLPVPYSVRVADAFGNGVGGISVDWAVTSGGGSVNPPQSTTDASGIATTTRTLGPSAGPQTATATAAGLTGSPVTFTATANAPMITTIAPDTLIEGQSATISGSGFSATPTNNTVLVGGVAATVSLASATSLVITVPTSNCLPARDVGVSVTVGSTSSNTVSVRLHPASFLDLAVGGETILQDPSQFCLQFRPSASGGDAYLVGVGAAAELPSNVLPFTLTGVGGASATSPAVATGPVPDLTAPRRASFGVTDAQVAARQLSQARGERVIRDWERRHLHPALFKREAFSAPRAFAPPVVGDTLHFNVPDFSAGNPCTTFTTITTVVRAIGASGIWVTDTANPTTDSLTTAEIQGYSDTFDLNIFDVDTTYFGAPTDLDANQRIFIVLTIQVNKDPLGIAGFVFGGDLFDPSVCGQSNGGEIFYGDVPDPSNASGTGARSKASVLGQMPSLIAHEFTHDIQLSRRLLLGATTFMSSWEMEGQAVLADEVVGHSVLGNAPGQNYGATVAFGADAGNRWYGFAGAGAFQSLPEYYGWLPPGSTTKAADAPELCTLFGTTSLTTNCDPFAFYGASWSLQRYISDRFGSSHPGGEAGINRDLIEKNVTLAGVPNVQAVVGVDFDSLFSQWGAMLYVDDRVAGLPGALTMPSWNLLDVFDAFASDAFRLVPTSRTFLSFSDSRNVRGGSNAYTLVSAVGPRPALALRVRDGADAVLGTSMKPQLWVVRVQ